MAKQWSLSRSVIDKIVGEFAAMGQVVRVRRRGTLILPEHILPAPSPAGHKSSAVRIEEAVQGMIAGGRLRRGDRIPLVKNMCREFGVAPATVIAAYGELARKGFISKRGKSFVLGGPFSLDSGRKAAQVMLLLPDGAEAEDVYCRDYLHDAFTALESELRLAGLQVEIGSLRDLPLLAGRWRRGRDCPHALVIWKLTKAIAPNLQGVSADLKFLMDRKGLSVLIDTESSIDIGLRGRCATLSRPRIGRFMLRRLCTLLVQRGVREAVLWDLYQDPKKLTELFEEEMRNFSEGFSAVKAPCRVPAGAGKAPSLQEAVRFAAPYFETAYKSKNVPNWWICSSDAAAAVAVSWARNRGINIPRDLRIIGFDNDPRFLHLGITTFSFEWERLGVILAHFLVGDLPVEKSTRGFLKYSGLLIERESARF